MILRLSAAFSAFVLITSPASAAQVDLTTLTPFYNPGSGFVPGIPPGWTDTQAPNLLTIYNGDTLTDGPHNDLSLGSFNNVLATVDITVSSATGFPGTFGSIYVDTYTGYFGITVGEGVIGKQYDLNGQEPVYQAGPSFSGDSIEVELQRVGSEGYVSYSAGGSPFIPIMSVGGFGGGSQLDLTEYGGGAPGLTTEFSNLIVTGSATPEPSVWTIMLIGFGGLGAAMRSRRRTATA